MFFSDSRQDSLRIPWIFDGILWVQDSGRSSLRDCVGVGTQGGGILWG